MRRTMRPLVRSRHDRHRQHRTSASPPPTAWLPILALLYDPFLWLGEIAGMRSRRKALLDNARGRVVEIGAGTGLNVSQYPDGIAELALTEPDAAMRRSSRVACSGMGASRGSSTRLRIVYRWPMRPWTPSSRRSSCAPSTTPNALWPRSRECSARMGSCCSSNTCARARGSSPCARTPCCNRGAASQAAAAATGRPWN